MSDFHAFSNFTTMGLDASIEAALAAMKLETPTEIQSQAIPPALEGSDILGMAQTGTGKTAAFTIPLIQKLLHEPETNALIMTPTRELATQVMKQVNLIKGKNQALQTALLIGGEAMGKQFKALGRGPRIIIGTPGRINDHLQRGSLHLKKIGFFVLDEADRMLDMGFSVQIERTITYMPKDRQTLLFSATLPNNILKLAAQFMKNPIRISVKSSTTAPKNITHAIHKVSPPEKYPLLLQELEARQGSIILFVKTKYGTETMAKKLRNDGHSTIAIHGDLRQNRRDRVMADFRDEKYRILVATDVAARGLDIPHIQHVINYDLPQLAEDYIHRIGRTARAGAVGEALCFVIPSERAKWQAIERIIDPDAKQERDTSGGRAAGRSGGRTGGRGGKFRNASGGGDNHFKKGKPSGFKGRVSQGAGKAHRKGPAKPASTFSKGTAKPANTFSKGPAKPAEYNGKGATKPAEYNGKGTTRPNRKDTASLNQNATSNDTKDQAQNTQAFKKTRRKPSPTQQSTKPSQSNQSNRSTKPKTHHKDASSFKPKHAHSPNKKRNAKPKTQNK